MHVKNGINNNNKNYSLRRTTLDGIQSPSFYGVSLYSPTYIVVDFASL